MGQGAASARQSGCLWQSEHLHPGSDHAAFEGQMYPAIEVRFNKAGMRLAWPLDETLG
jgi:hypothetical protein